MCGGGGEVAIDAGEVQKCRNGFCDFDLENEVQSAAISRENLIA